MWRRRRRRQTSRLAFPPLISPGWTTSRHSQSHSSSRARAGIQSGSQVKQPKKLSNYYKILERWNYYFNYKLAVKLLSVLERIPVFARFNVLDFIDLGGDLNIKVTLDNTEDEYDDPIPAGLHQEVYICISKDRQPKLVSFWIISGRCLWLQKYTNL